MGEIIDNFIKDFSAVLNINNVKRNNITIGSRLKLFNKDSLYIFYGYNYDKSIISCFPIASHNITDNLEYMPVIEIEKIYDN